MKTASVRELRNSFAKISEWLEAGETVEVTKNGQPFADLVPKLPGTKMPESRPDIMSRLKSQFGDYVWSDESYEKMVRHSRKGRE